MEAGGLVGEARHARGMMWTAGEVPQGGAPHRRHHLRRCVLCTQRHLERARQTDARGSAPRPPTCPTPASNARAAARAPALACVGEADATVMRPAAPGSHCAASCCVMQSTSRTEVAVTWRCGCVGWRVDAEGAAARGEQPQRDQRQSGQQSAPCCPGTSASRRAASRRAAGKQPRPDPPSQPDLQPPTAADRRAPAAAGRAACWRSTA